MFLLFLLANCAAVFAADPWPGGIVPYDIPECDCQLETIKDAIKAVQENTCVKFVPKKNGDIYLNFQKAEREYTTSIGYNGKTHPIFVTKEGLDYNVLFKVKHEHNVGEVIHELLHALGLSDENNRPDRDDFVRVDWDNVKEDKKKYFSIDKAAVTYNLPYDYHSIMHQNENYLSTSSSPSLTPKRLPNKKDRVYMGQRKGMSCSDILKINLLYNCTEHLTTERKSKYIFEGSCPPIVLQASPRAADKKEGYLYYAKEQAFYEMSLSNYSEELVVNTRYDDIAMAVDCNRERVFWFDHPSNQMCWVYFWDHLIVKASFDAQEFPAGLGGIVFNSRINHLYLTNPPKKHISYMRVANLTITTITGQIDTEWSPQGITFDPRVELLFWYECMAPVNFQCRIMRARITQVPKAKNVTVIVKSHILVSLSESKTLHASFNKLYTIYLSEIITYNYNGDKRELFASIAKSTPLHITSSKDWLYWTATGTYPYSYLRIFKAKRAQNHTVSWIIEKRIKTDVEPPEQYSGIYVCRDKPNKRRNY